MRSAIRIPLAFAVLLTLAGCERWALDRQMEKLCKKDGGVKVYEQVTLPATYFYADGRLKLGPRTDFGTTSTSEDSYFRSVGEDAYRIISRRQVLVGALANPERGDGQLVRLHWAVYRWSDRKLLGEQVEYGRSGGDGFTFGFHPSSASCPHVDRGVEGSVFVKGD